MSDEPARPLRRFRCPEDHPRPWEKRLAKPVAIRWIITRALMLILLNTIESGIYGDVHYYRDSIRDAELGGFGGILREYPLPAVWALLIPDLMNSLYDTVSYAGYFVGLAVIFDAVFTWVLVRKATTPRRDRAVVMWLWAVPLLGPLAYTRYDLIPGALLGASLLWFITRPLTSAAAAAWAAGIKLWPVIVLPGIVAASDRWFKKALLLAAWGAVIVALAWQVNGLDRIMSPFEYQRVRGLQIESLAAAPVMFAWSVHPQGYDIILAESKSMEIIGTGSGFLRTVSTLATGSFAVLMVVVWLYLAYRLLRGKTLTLRTLVWLSLGVVAGYIVTNRVLSPQYMLWILPLCASGLILLPTQRMWMWSRVLLVATGMTQVVYPLSYRLIVDHYDGLSFVAVSIMTFRNMLLVWLFFYAGWQFVRSLRHEHTMEPIDRPAEMSESTT